MHPATYTQLPLRPYASPGPRGVDRDNYIDWGYPVRGTVHVGDDIKARSGTPVYAIAHGILRLAVERGSPKSSNWGWVLVLEHQFRDGTTHCSVYGHCSPTVHRVGDFVPTGSTLATVVDYTPVKPSWGNHLHFAVHHGPFGARSGTYPSWLTGYLKPAQFPAAYVDPYAFCLERFPRQVVDRTSDERSPRPIRTNTPLEGEGIDVPGDEDWFSFVGKRGRTLSFSVTREYGTLIPQLAVFRTDARGRATTRILRGVQEDWRTQVAPMLLEEDGTFLVKIRGAGSTTGIYRFEKQV